jgi:hypothetical protein
VSPDFDIQALQAAADLKKGLVDTIAKGVPSASSWKILGRPTTLIIK